MTIDIKLILEYSKSLSVLYVEDDAILSKITLKIFKHYFKHIDVAFDGEEGCEKYEAYYKEHGENYDVVITDINMPKLDGIAMSKIIKNISMSQCILFVTAHNESHYLIQALEVGSSGFLSKPIQVDQLNSVLYSATQRVFEHKLVSQYYEEIEKLYEELQTKNSTLLSKNMELEKSLRMLNTMVEKDMSKEISSEETSLTDVSVHEALDEFEEDDLAELESLCTDIDGAIISILSSNGDMEVTKKSLLLIVKYFSKFAAIISYYSIFSNLSSTLNSFVSSIEHNPLPSTSQEIVDIFTLLESFIFVLKKWQTNLANGEFDSINYLDASLIGDMETIVMLYTPTTECEGEIDFF